MADNTTLNPGVGGDVIRNKDRGGVKTSIVSLDLNPGGAESLIAGAVPVSQVGTWNVGVNNFPAGFQAVQSGVWTVGVSGSVAVTGTFWQATQPVSIAAVVTVTGTVVANVGTGTQPVSGTFWQATQPVSGTFWQATQPVSIAALPVLPAGTANIGDVDVLSLPPLPAGTNLIGQVSGSNETGTVYSGSTALVPRFAVFSLSATGTVVPLVGGKRIRVLRWRASANGAVNIKWQSHVAGDISGLSYCTQYKDVGAGYCPVGQFQTVAGEALDLNLSAGISVSGELVYLEI